MARILALNPPFQGLTSIVNVLHRVGPQEFNDPTDVKIVQALLRMHNSPFANKVGVPQMTGNYDAVTGFFIYDTQYFLKTKGGHQSVIVDGIVSPAQGGTYSAGAPWTIVLLNLQAKRDNPADYAAFLDKATSGTL
jgi:hypothetical protein